MHVDASLNNYNSHTCTCVDKKTRKNYKKKLVKIMKNNRKNYKKLSEK